MWVNIGRLHAQMISYFYMKYQVRNSISKIVSEKCIFQIPLRIKAKPDSVIRRKLSSK